MGMDAIISLPGLATTAITGTLTLTKSGSTARVATFLDLSGTVAYYEYAGTWTAAQTFSVSTFIGAGSGQRFLRINGGNSASGDGAYIVTQANGTSVAALGNYSSIVGGAFDATPIIWFNGGMKWVEAATTRMHLDSSGNLGIGVTPTAGNGLLQLASGTTKANGVAFGTDTFFFRSGAGTVDCVASSGASQVRVLDSTSVTALTLYADSVTAILSSITSKPLQVRTNNTVALTADISQGITTAAANYVKTRSVTSAAGTTALDSTDDTAILTGATTHTFTLPAAAAGRRLFIKNRSSGALTVNRAGSDTIDGGTTLNVAAGTAKILIVNGADWCVWNA